MLARPVRKHRRSRAPNKRPKMLIVANFLAWVFVVKEFKHTWFLFNRFSRVLIQPDMFGLSLEHEREQHSSQGRLRKWDVKSPTLVSSSAGRTRLAEAERR